MLVLLYERGGGGLRVLLTTRSKELRSHPGQTALPGGKVDDSDGGVVQAAVRPPFQHSLFSLYRLLLSVCVCVTHTVQGSERRSRVAVELSARPHAVHARAVRIAIQGGRDARGRLLGRRLCAGGVARGAGRGGANIRPPARGATRSRAGA